MDKQRSTGVVIFAYLGFMSGILGVIKSVPEVDLYSILFNLVIIIFSYGLLKLKNWARILLLIINSLLAICVISYNVLVFSLGPFIISGGGTNSFFEAFRITFNKLVEIFKVQHPNNTFLAFTAFLICLFYLFGYIIFFTRPKVKAQFTGSLGDNKEVS